MDNSFFNGTVWRAFVSTDISTFSVGSIPFATAAHHISDDNSEFFWDADNDRLGIGTNTPDTKLEIFNAGNQLKLSFDGTDNATFGVDTDGDLTVTPTGDTFVVAAFIRTLGNYLSEDGSPGVTGATCSAWKNGLCTTA